MDRGAQRAAVHGVAKSWTRLSDPTEVKTPFLKFMENITRESGVDPDLDDRNTWSSHFQDMGLAVGTLATTSEYALYFKILVDCNWAIVYHNQNK